MTPTPRSPRPAISCVVPAYNSGVQLLSIDILGEYVGAIFDAVKQRPLYGVGSEVGRGAMPMPSEPHA